MWLTATHCSSSEIWLRVDFPVRPLPKTSYCIYGCRAVPAVHHASAVIIQPCLYLLCTLAGSSAAPPASPPAAPAAHNLHLANKIWPPKSFHPALHRQWYKFLYGMDVPPVNLTKLDQKQIWRPEQERTAVKWQQMPGIQHLHCLADFLPPTETFWSTSFSLTSSPSLILIFTEICTLRVVWECVSFSPAVHIRVCCGVPVAGHF